MPTILFVDDDVLTQWVMTEVLTDAGFSVRSACRGEEALEFMAESEGGGYDALVTDVNLYDGVSGMVVARRWRRLYPGRPIIFISNSEVPESEMRPNEAYLAKPFAASALLHLLDAVLLDSRLDLQCMSPPPSRWRQRPGYNAGGNGAAQSRRAAPPNTSVRADQRGKPPQRQQIALGAEPGDHPIGAARDEGVMPEFLALMHVGDVDLDHRPVKGVERVQDGNGVVGERRRVDGNPRPRSPAPHGSSR